MKERYVDLIELPVFHPTTYHETDTVYILVRVSQHFSDGVKMTQRKQIDLSDTPMKVSTFRFWLFILLLHGSQ